MTTLLWLLLPIAALSGWWAARHDQQHKQPKPIPRHYLKGINYLLNEQPDKAIDLFVNIVDLDADTVETYIVLGNLMRRRGEVERAIRLHQSLIARPNLDNQSKADALLELGRDYLKAGMFDRARHLLHGVLDTDSHQLEALHHLREIYEQEKEWEDAIQNARQIERHNGGSQHNLIAQYYCELGELALSGGGRAGQEEAIAHARKALSFNSGCARAHLMLGDISNRQDDPHAAIRHYREAYQQRPAFAPRIIQRLQDAYQKLGDTDGFQRFLSGVHHEQHALFPALSLLKSIQSQGNGAELEDVFDSAFKTNPSSLVLLREYIEAITENRIASDQQSLRKVLGVLEHYLGGRPTHECSNCQLQVHSLFWQCPSCHQWDTLEMVEPYAEKVSQQPYLV